jgi:DNA-binding beta-propeller fold protein YncE
MEEAPSDIAVINPVQGVIVSAFPVGATANDFALSPDGNFLYVVLNRLGAVRRFRMPSHTRDLDIELDTRPAEARRTRPDLNIYAIAPLPGKQGAVATSSETGVMVFDDATRRMGFVRGQKIDAFELKPDGELTGKNATDTFSFAVDAAGIRVTGSAPLPPRLTPAALANAKPVERIAYGATVVGGSHIRDLTQRDLLAAVETKSIPANGDRNPPTLKIVRYELNSFSEVANVNLDLTGIQVLSIERATDGIAWEQGIALAIHNKLYLVRRDQLKDVPRNTLPAPVRDSQNIIRLPVDTESVAYDSRSKNIFATPRNKVGAPGNSVLRIDPATGEVVSFFVGIAPGPVAVTDDGRYLYVGLQSAPVINRIDLKTLQIESSIDVLAEPAPQRGASPPRPTSEKADWRAGVIRTVAGNPDLVVVLRARPTGQVTDNGRILYNRHDVVAYDHGVLRPRSIPSESNGIVPLTPGDGPGVFMLGRRRLVVDAQGIAVERTYPIDVGSVVQPGLFLRGTELLRLDTSGPARIVGHLNQGFRISADRTLFTDGSSTATTTVADAERRRVYSLYSTGPSDAHFSVISYDLDTVRPVAVGRVDNISYESNTSGYEAQDRVMLIEGTTLVIRSGAELVFYPLSAMYDWPEPKVTTEDFAPGLRKIFVQVNDLAGDLAHGKLVATSASTMGAWRNSVLTINPQNGAVESVVFVGSAPERLVVSPDGRHIYVTLPGEGRIARIDTTAGKRDLLFDSDVRPPAGSRGSNLPSSVQEGRTPVASMAVSPAGGILAVSYDNATIAIFDQGVRRELTGAAPPQSPSQQSQGQRIAFDGSGQKLYAWNDNGEVRTFSVTARGLEALDTVRLALTVPPKTDRERGFLAGAVFSDELFYTSSGEILKTDGSGLAGYLGIPERFRVDPNSRNVQPSAYAGANIVDSAAGRIYRGGRIMLVYDEKSRDLIAVRTMPELTETRVRPTSNLEKQWRQWGPGGLAFRTADAVVTLETSTIPLLAVPEPSPQTPPQP